MPIMPDHLRIQSKEPRRRTVMHLEVTPRTCAVAFERLDMNRPVPSGPNDLSQTLRIVLIRLVDLHFKSGTRMLGVETKTSRPRLRSSCTRELSRYRMKNARDLRLAYFQATATAARHMFIADARKARCVLAEVRWRWTLKVL